MERDEDDALGCSALSIDLGQFQAERLCQLPGDDSGIKTICVIGAGAAGLAALKAITETPQHRAGLWKVTAFESRDNVGGVWRPCPPLDDPPITPLYDSLTTNLPHPAMAYKSFPFPPSTPLFPHASIVQTYLESYCGRFQLALHIRLNTTVLDVQRFSHKWRVQVSTGEIVDFDIVIVANGHHRVPRYPDIPGLSKWKSEGKVTHSAWYRRPQDHGNTVVVVGGGPSGQDISAELCSVADSVVHSVPGTKPEDVGNLKRRGRIVQFMDHGEVLFEDGTIQAGIDRCILATGYETAFPFLQDQVIRIGHPPPCPPLPCHLFNSSFHVFPLAMQMFPIQKDFPPPSLAFMGLPVKVAPFPLFEAQACAIVEVIAHPDLLDPARGASNILDRYENLKSRFGDDPQLIWKNWHRFSEDEQFDYRDKLYEFSKPDPGRRLVCQQWEKDMYDKRVVLRLAWRKAVRDRVVGGVGNGGQEDWAAMIAKLLVE